MAVNRLPATVVLAGLLPALLFPPGNSWAYRALLNPLAITLDAGADGTVNLNTVKTTELQAISRKEGDLMWQSQSGSGQRKETTQYHRLSGLFKVAATRVSVQVGVKAAG